MESVVIVNNSLSTLAATTDKVCDYIPIISSVVNLIDIFQKCIPSNRENVDSPYKQHLYQKSFGRCFLLLIPFFGNLGIGIYDIFSRGSTSTAPQNSLKIPQGQEAADESSDVGNSELLKRVERFKDDELVWEDEGLTFEDIKQPMDSVEKDQEPAYENSDLLDDELLKELEDFGSQQFDERLSTIDRLLEQVEDIKQSLDQDIKWIDNTYSRGSVDKMVVKEYEEYKESKEYLSSR